MAWKTQNNQPMPEEKAFERIRSFGYEPLEPYVNNRYRMNCRDSEGFIVKISLDSLGRCKSYQRYSITCNEENYINNLNLLGKNKGYDSTVIFYRPSKTKNHVMLKCKCSCGELFDVDANDWRRGKKTRCNNCNHFISDIELAVRKYLDELGVLYQPQKKFDDCKYQRPLPFDFYLPQFNCCIEVDGEQHFYECSKYFHSRPMDSFELLQKKDNIKTNFCKNNNIKLIRIPYFQIRDTDKYKKVIKEELNIH